MKKYNFITKVITFGIVILFFSLASASSVNINFRKVSNFKDTEYWALIFAVGIYYKNPWQNRPSMIEAAENLYDVLLDSPNWRSDHIHKITGTEASGQRLIQELIWLIQNVERDDNVFIYLTSHGSPLKNIFGMPVDIPPIDEADGADEILAMYKGFDQWYAFIWDDLLNIFLSLMKSEHVCLVVDSCHAGGFNDDPMFSKNTYDNYNAEVFAKEFAEDLTAQGRVILMACEEDELSYGSFFSNYLINGLNGMADNWGNKDGINSAEESFIYAKYWVNLLCSFNPTIYDLYPGEYTITYT